MKVVVNRCYGGFGISPLALKELVLRDAKCIEKHEPKDYYGGGKDWEKDFERDISECEEGKDGFKFHKMGFFIYKDGVIFSLKHRYKDETRSDEDLVEVVKKLGKKSFGRFSKLEIIEIPDDVDWFIDDYDGMETIREQHRTW